MVKINLDEPSANPSTHRIELKANRTSIAAGAIRFEVANQSKSLIHEMPAVKTTAPPSALPRDPQRHEVAESKIDSLGDVSELKPGASGALTIDLKPGEYLLICNRPGHVDAGMAVRLTGDPARLLS